MTYTPSEHQRKINAKRLEQAMVVKFYATLLAIAGITYFVFAVAIPLIIKFN